MKQVIQNYSTGELDLADVPAPVCSPGKMLVRNAASVISIGTERSVIELGKKSLLGKARARPDLVRRFLQKARNEGFAKTFKEALGRLDTPTALGYSSAGVVVETGAHVPDFSPGDRVACIGAGYASHAEFITVPPTLCCKVPEGVSLEDASFGMVGIIALHGIRCAGLTFGASAVVIGLGLLGLLSVQILKAYGCRVFGFDIDPAKAVLEKSVGADFACADESGFKLQVGRDTSGYGVDAVIITAGTKSDGPVNLAVDLVMFRGRIVLVGVADIHPQRNEMWRKEIEIIVSRAGGPGSFDPLYENKGIDYPAGYVRWTENRNLAEFLGLISAGKVHPGRLITHRYPITEATETYEKLLNGKLQNCVGVVLEYPGGQTVQAPEGTQRRMALKPAAARGVSDVVSIGVIGAGLFGKALFLPCIASMKGVRLKALSTASGANSCHVGKKYSFEACTTDYREILDDKDVDAVLVLTPHSLHAVMVCEALESGKDVFVEKPLCISEEQLCGLVCAYRKRESPPFLMVGYNRRFSPHAERVLRYFEDRRDPMVIHYRVNSGFLPQDHWVHSEEEGGGRIIGEVCHFIDFMQFLTGADPVRAFAERISGNNKTAVNNDNVTITLKFSDGSVGNILYSGSGDKAFSRERIEVFCEGKTAVSVDFRETTLHSGGGRKSFKTSKQALGYEEELRHFLDVVSGKVKPLISAGEAFFSTAAVLGIQRSLESGAPSKITVPQP